MSKIPLEINFLETQSLSLLQLLRIEVSSPTNWYLLAPVVHQKCKTRPGQRERTNLSHNAVQKSVAATAESKKEEDVYNVPRPSQGFRVPPVAVLVGHGVSPAPRLSLRYATCRRSMACSEPRCRRLPNIEI